MQAMPSKNLAISAVPLHMPYVQRRPELARWKSKGKRIRGAKERLRRLVDQHGRLVLPPGGLQSMASYHLALVRGGAWRRGDERW